MKRTQAKKLGIKLAQAGVIEQPGVGGKLGKGTRSVHGAAAITGQWTETPQRRARQRVATIVCVDVAEAMIAGGWSITALGACSHTANARRIAAAVAA